MTKEQVLSDIKSLIEDIDKCTWEIVRAKKDRDTEAINSHHWKMEGLIVAAHQELSFLYDHIKVLYGLKDKADELYFRVGALSASSNSTEAMRKAWNDYWHYVNYELNKEGGKE
jgi:hypothetical protein